MNLPPHAATSDTRVLARRWWQRPLPLALLLTAVLLAVVAAVAVALAGFGVPAAPREAGPAGLPWQVRTLADGGSEVFGLQPGRSTVTDVTRRFGDELRLALVVAGGQPPALEAFVENFRAGFVNGKLVMAFEADPAWLAEAVARSPRREYSGDGQARRHALAPADLALAQAVPLAALAFLPAARLDEATLVARFGPPSERVVGAQGEVQLLYPAWGLAATVPPAEGDLARAKAVLQYVAPPDFDRRLRHPLVQAGATAAASSPAR
jgi:hypothetical protein